jgi:hypothetical protein
MAPPVPERSDRSRLIAQKLKRVVDQRPVGSSWHTTKALPNEAKLMRFAKNIFEGWGAFPEG